MLEFVGAHPGVAVALMGGLVSIGLGISAIAIFFYKSNNNAAAALIASELKNLGEKLDAIFTKIERQDAKIDGLTDKQAKLETKVAQQVQRCDDRERSCPGREVKQSLRQAP